jgi:hypothetical protein
MLIRGVVRDEIDDQLDTAGMNLDEQLIEVGERAKGSTSQKSAMS